MRNTDSMQILLVGSETTSRSTYCAAMATDHCVTTVADVDEGMAHVNGDKPNLIVLHTPVLEDAVVRACTKLSSNSRTATIPVVFLAERASLNDKLNCYEAGAYDFITTPIGEHELREKLRIIQQHIHRHVELSEQARTASETALSAMTGNSELGQAIRFVEKSYSCANYSELAHNLLSVTTALDLQGCLLVDAKDGMQFFGCRGEVSPLEQQLLERVHTDGTRFRDFGKRTLVAYPLVTLLIKDMPLTDPDRYGRMKDLLPSMLGAASARVAALNTEMALQRQTHDVAAIFCNVRETLKELGVANAKNQNAIMDTMREMLNELDFRLPSMGLEDDQEAYLIKRIDMAVDEAGALITQGESLASAFDNISLLLEHLAAQQQEIADMVCRETSAADDDHAETGGGDDDIELF